MPVTTNNHHREIIDAWQLTQDERKEFDYLDWPAIEDGRGSAQFFRYRGQLYDLGEFMRGSCPEGWDGGMAFSYSCGLVVRFVDDYESVVVGWWLA